MLPKKVAIDIKYPKISSIPCIVLLLPCSDISPFPVPGTGFTSPDLELSLPGERTVAEVAWFGLCRASDATSVLASVVILPQVVSNVPCNTTLIGELATGTYGTAGRVYFLDRLTFAVLGFSYNGQAPGIYREIIPSTFSLPAACYP